MKQVISQGQIEWRGLKGGVNSKIMAGLTAQDCELTEVQTYQKYDVQLSACSQCRVHTGLVSCQAVANGGSVHDLKLFTSANVVSQRPLGSSLQFGTDKLANKAHSEEAMID